MKHMTKILLLLLITTPFLHAQNADPSSLIDDLAPTVHNWQFGMSQALNYLFFSLVALDFTWTAFKLGLKSTPLEGWVSAIIYRLMFYGFGVFMLRNGSQFSKDIIDSFIELAGIASNNNFENYNESSFWKAGLKGATQIYETATGMSFLRDALNLIFALVAVVITLLFTAFVSSVIALAYAEAYLAIGVSSILLAFGGSEWTKDYGKKFFTFSISAGLKLFATLLTADLGLVIIQEVFQSLVDFDFLAVAMALLTELTVATLIFKIPNTVVAISNGRGTISSNAENTISGLAGQAGSAARTATTGASAALGAASALSTQQGATGISKVAATAKNLAQSFAADLKAPSKGDIKAQNSDGLAAQGHRMSADMSAKVEALKASSIETNTISAGDESSSTATVATAAVASSTSINSDSSTSATPSIQTTNKDSPLDSTARLGAAESSASKLRKS